MTDEAAAPTIRPGTPDDVPALVDLALAAWEPVFASVAAQLAGSGLYDVLRPDWRDDQRRAVIAAHDDPDVELLVADLDGAVAGFVTVAGRDDGPLGELQMIAVAPGHQRRGVARRLTGAAVDRIAARGLAVAMVETGGDPGHAPARRLYESAGFTPLPVVRYFRRTTEPAPPERRRPADVATLPQHQHEAAVALWHDVGLTRPWNDPVADLDRALAGPSSTVLAARDDDGTLVGTVMVGHDGHRGWVYYLAVATHRQRTGLGRTLMAAAEDWLRERVPKVQLMVRDDNVAATEFYARLGYTPSEVVVLARRLDD